MSVLYSITRAERAEQVAALRADGLTYREVGERLGISPNYVRDLVNDPDGAKLAARVARYVGTCEDCGGPTSNGHNTAVPKVCASCYATRTAAQHGTRSKYDAGCGCDACREAHREGLREWRQRAKGNPPTHGTYNAYTNYGCRCDKCRAANTVHHRARDYEHQKAFARRVKGTEPPQHGTTYAYGVYGCRCEECRRAASEYGKQLRARKREAA